MPDSDKEKAEKIISGLRICGYSEDEAQEILIYAGLKGGSLRLDQEIIKTLQRGYGLSEYEAQQQLESKGRKRVLEDLRRQPQTSNPYSQQHYQADFDYENYNPNYEDTKEFDNSTPTNEKGEWKDVANLAGYGLAKAKKNKIKLGVIVGGLILGVIIIAFISRRTSENQQTNGTTNSFQSNGVVIRDNEPVRDAANINGKVLQTLSINSPLFILYPDKKQLWYEVKTQNGTTGWINGYGWRKSSSNNGMSNSAMNTANMMNTADMMNTTSNMANSSMSSNMAQTSSSEIASATPPPTQMQPLSTPDLDEQRLAEAKSQVVSWVGDRFSGNGQGTRCADSNISVGTSAYIIETDGLSIQVNKDINTVSEAEKRNDGTEWRGNANISAKAHRFYLRFSGGDTWEKTDWINYLSIKLTVRKQNGQWIAKSSDSLLAEGKIMGIPEDFEPFDCNKLSSLR